MISKVLGNKLLVTPLYDPDKSESGLLWIPDEAKERCYQGIVKYIGPDVKDISIGDHVLFAGYTGTLLVIQGESDLIALTEDDCECAFGPINVVIPGLYFRDSEGNYFTATYEQSQTIIANALSMTKWFKSTRMKFRSREVLENRKEILNTYRPEVG